MRQSHIMPPSVIMKLELNRLHAGRLRNTAENTNSIRIFFKNRHNIRRATSFFGAKFLAFTDSASRGHVLNIFQRLSACAYRLHNSRLRDVGAVTNDILIFHEFIPHKNTFDDYKGAFDCAPLHTGYHENGYRLTPGPAATCNTAIGPWFTAAEALG